MSTSPSSPIELTSDEKYDLLENLGQLQNLEHLGSIAQSLALLAEAGGPTTARQQYRTSQNLVTEVAPTPVAEVAVSANDSEITFSDGRTVPTAAVRALTAYDETTWAGALLPEARAAVAYVVLNSVEVETEPVLRTNYPFCLAPNPVKGDPSSPCIKRTEHGGHHQNNEDQVWL